MLRRRHRELRPHPLSRHDASAFMYAFDLIELDGNDLRQEPLQVRKATLVSLLFRAACGVRFN